MTVRSAFTSRQPCNPRRRPNMSRFESFVNRISGRSSRVALLAYCAVLVFALGATCASVMYILDRYDTFSDSRLRVERLQKRPLAERQGSSGDRPLLEGNTSTVASAGLLQRVNGAVTSA